jgi:hypothetical protein
MNLGRARHPERLPWFASGHLDRADAAAIERHLRSCDACRAEVSALRSMYRSIHAEVQPEHVSAAQLVAYHDLDPRVSDAQRRLVEEHVRKCHGCSADLAALRRADVPARARHARRWLGIAASVLIVVSAGWQIALRRAESPASPVMAHVVFSPAQRGADTAPRLLGPGPWELEVWLPLHAPATDYRARIYPGDEPLTTVFDGITTAGSKRGSVHLVVPGGFRPGHYVLSLSSRDDSGSEDIVHGFDVLSPQ